MRVRTTRSPRRRSGCSPERVPPRAHPRHAIRDGTIETAPGRDDQGVDPTPSGEQRLLELVSWVRARVDPLLSSPLVARAEQLQSQDAPRTELAIRLVIGDLQLE